MQASSIADYQQLAQQKLPAEVWRYLSDGAGAGRTMAANIVALNDASLMTRPLADVSSGHTRLKLFGQEYAHPLLLAPIAYQRLFHADGELAAAMAAEAQGAPTIVSSLASMTIDSIAESGAALWFQLYWQGSRENTLALLLKAEAAGCKAIVLTVDAPVKQASFNLPPGISAVNLTVNPEADMRIPVLAKGQSEVFDYWMARAPRWSDVVWLREQTKLPLLIKGLLHADDAAQAVGIGRDGVVVSNHGGRVLDGTPASLPALAAITVRLGNKTTILFDSGIRSGSDAFKAIALGAHAVLIGRPYIWGLAAGGALGVAHVIRLLRDELEMTMALTGHASIASILEARPE